MTYTLTVANEGSAAVAGPLTVSDVMPDGLRPTGTSGIAPCTIDGSVVNCVKPGGLDPGDTFAVGIKAEVTGDRLGEIRNVASVKGSGVETDLANNNGEASIRVIEGHGATLPRTGAQGLRLVPLAFLLVTGGLVLLLHRRHHPLEGR